MCVAEKEMNGVNVADRTEVTFGLYDMCKHKLEEYGGEGILSAVFQLPYFRCRILGAVVDTQNVRGHARGLLKAMVPYKAPYRLQNCG